MLGEAPDAQAAAEELALLGPEQSERGGTPLFFRTPAVGCGEERTASFRLASQQILVAGMLRPAHLLDLVHNFILFQQVEGRTRKIVARYQQFHVVNKAAVRLLEGRTRLQGALVDERGGIPRARARA